MFYVEMNIFVEELTCCLQYILILFVTVKSTQEIFHYSMLLLCFNIYYLKSACGLSHLIRPHPNGWQIDEPYHQYSFYVLQIGFSII